MSENNEKNYSDHDLLIRIDEKLKLLHDSFTQSEKDREKKDIDFDLRIRRLEKWGAMGAGVLFFIQFISEISK